MIADEPRTMITASEPESGAMQGGPDERWLISAMPPQDPETLRLTDLFARSVPITRWGINE